jgi:hypothetical protein
MATEEKETAHGRQRRSQAAAGDTHRIVGDPDRVVREGKNYRDSETDCIVCVLGNRVVVLNAKGQQVSQFKNSAANTRKRVEKGRWVPMEES